LQSFIKKFLLFYLVNLDFYLILEFAVVCYFSVKDYFEASFYNLLPQDLYVSIMATNSKITLKSKFAEANKILK